MPINYRNYVTILFHVVTSNAFNWKTKYMTDTQKYLHFLDSIKNACLVGITLWHSQPVGNINMDTHNFDCLKTMILESLGDLAIKKNLRNFVVDLCYWLIRFTVNWELGGQWFKIEKASDWRTAQQRYK